MPVFLRLRFEQGLYQGWDVCDLDDLDPLCGFLPVFLRLRFEQGLYQGWDVCDLDDLDPLCGFLVKGGE